MGENFIAVRPKPDDLKLVETIRKHLKGTTGDDSDAAVFRFAIREAVKALLPKKTKRRST
ncbi:MAG TPA: hypothetical protein VGP89_06375 [Candidatus Angelobacter sp.]|jgi:hypothetical protein|nr:hypothetical protein [Candidatus Angelobacter sp.]